MSTLFSNERQDLRQSYIDAWQKQTEGQLLSPLEAQIVDIISLHPEYHDMLAENHVDKDYLPEMGETNPFLHMSLHMAIREQIHTNRPSGIADIFQQLCKNHEAHHVEHMMFEVLAETLWQAQRDNTLPDETAYLEKLQQLLRK